MVQEKQPALGPEAEWPRLLQEPPWRLTQLVEELKRQRVQPARQPAWEAQPA